MNPIRGLFYIVEAFVGSTTAVIMAIWNIFVQWISGFLAWLFDVGQWLEFATRCLGWFITALGWIMPGEIGTRVENFGQWIRDVPVQKALALGFFFMSPLVTIGVLKAALAVVLLAWFIALTIRCIVYVSSLVWTNPG